MSQKRLLSLGFVLFALSVIFLFWKNTTLLDPTREQAWWAIGFVDLQNTRNPSFFIENRSKVEQFTYRVEHGALLLSEGKFSLTPGEKKEIRIDSVQENSETLRVRVATPSSEKEIYR